MFCGAGEGDANGVTRRFLNATNEKALGKINLEDLKAFAVDKEQK